MQEMFAPERIATEMINFYKSATINACQTMSLVQEQTERMFAVMWEQGFTAHKESMKMWQDWLSNNKKTRDEFTKMMGESFDRAQDFFAPRKK